MKKFAFKLWRWNQGWNLDFCTARSVCDGATFGKSKKRVEVLQRKMRKTFSRCPSPRPPFATLKTREINYCASSSHDFSILFGMRFLFISDWTPVLFEWDCKTNAIRNQRNYGERSLIKCHEWVKNISNSSELFCVCFRDWVSEWLVEPNERL